MDEKKGFFGGLGDYMREVFDADGNGQVDVKEILHKVSHSAPILAILVVDILVLAAEFRVWDIAITMTHSWLKAIGFVLISAVPFYLGQVLWIYPRGTWFQKLIAIGILVGGLTSSAVFGRADLFLGIDLQMDTAYLMNLVIGLTVSYIVALLFYVVFDPSVKAWRMKINANANAKQQREFLEITRKVMADMAITQRFQKEIEDQFGDPKAVRDQMKRLKGEKIQVEQQPAQVAYAETTERTELKQANPQNGEPPKR